MRAFFIVLFLAFIALSLEINMDKLSQEDTGNKKEFIAKLAFWLPDEKTDEEKLKEQEDYLKNAETLDLSAIEKASRAIDAQKVKEDDALVLDEKFKEIIDEPTTEEKDASELSTPLFAQNQQEESPAASLAELENSETQNLAPNQNSQISQGTQALQDDLVQTTSEQGSQATLVEIEELSSEQIAFEGFEVTKTPSLIITNFTLRNRIDSRHRGVFSFALVYADGQKKYLEFSPATYNFLRLVAKNYEIPIPNEMKAEANNAYGFMVEVKNNSNRLLLSRFYKF